MRANSSEWRAARGNRGRYVRHLEGGGGGGLSFFTWDLHEDWAEQDEVRREASFLFYEVWRLWRRQLTTSNNNLRVYIYLTLFTVTINTVKISWNYRKQLSKVNVVGGGWWYEMIIGTRWPCQQGEFVNQLKLQLWQGHNYLMFILGEGGGGGGGGGNS